MLIADPQLPAPFKYFWFIAAVFMAINVAVWRNRLTEVVRRGIATKQEVDRVMAFVAAWLVGTPLILGIIAVASGWSSPLCALAFGFNTVPGFLISLVNVLGGVVLLWWVWRGTGAEVLSRIGPVLARKPNYDKTYSPKSARLLATFIAFSAIIGAAWRPTPASPELTCAPAVTGQPQPK